MFAPLSVVMHTCRSSPRPHDTSYPPDPRRVFLQYGHPENMPSASIYFEEPTPRQCSEWWGKHTASPQHGGDNTTDNWSHTFLLRICIWAALCKYFYRVMFLGEREFDRGVLAGLNLPSLLCLIQTVQFHQSCKITNHTVGHDLINLGMSCM